MDSLLFIGCLLLVLWRCCGGAVAVLWRCCGGVSYKIEDIVL